MTSTYAVEAPTARQAGAAKRRADYHEARIKAARGQRVERLRIVDWLKAELANGGDLDRVIELARSMNRRLR